MAKRSAAAQESVNVSREVLAIVEGNQAIRGTEVLTVMREEFSQLFTTTLGSLPREYSSLPAV